MIHRDQTVQNSIEGICDETGTGRPFTRGSAAAIAATRQIFRMEARISVKVTCENPFYSAKSGLPKPLSWIDLLMLGWYTRERSFLRGFQQ